MNADTGFQRIRVLDGVKKNIDDYLIYNPLFHSYISAFDSAFDRGVAADLDYYITRDQSSGTTYEDELLGILTAEHSNSIGKVYVLHGCVGSGKTTLCRYLAEKHPASFSGDVLIIRADIWPREEVGGDQTVLTDLLKDATFEAVQRFKLYEDKGAFYKTLFSALGFPPASSEEAYRMARDLSAEHLIEALINLKRFKCIVIIIDNIDELSDTTIREAIRFGIRIAQHARGFANMPFTVLLTVREYTVKRFMDQDHFAHKALRPLSAASVMCSKLDHARDEIPKIAKEYSQEVDYVPRGYRPPPPSDMSKRITITKDGACDFLKALSIYITSEKEHDFRDLIVDLAGGNLKFLVGNLYNFIHSCKLPLTSLFRAIFTPTDGSVKISGVFERISSNLALECLMCVHYPFYDVSGSHIINVFNLTGSLAPNNFRNTLSILRLLGFVNNSENVSYSEICNILGEYGYEKELIDKAINKCIEYGLVQSEHGRHTGHLTVDSLLSISSSGKMYFRILPKRYLRFVCEDTPMPEEFIVPLQEKYIPIRPSLEGADAQKNREKSAQKFVAFLKYEEELERTYIEDDLGRDWNGYINRVGIDIRGQKMTIANYLDHYISEEAD